MVACAIVAISFAGIYAGGWRSLNSLKSAMEGTSAGQLLMNLQEQIRTTTWTQITDPTYLSGTILPGSTQVGHLSNVTQTIIVNPYPLPNGYSGNPANGPQTIEATCGPDGSITTPYTGNGLIASQSAVRVDITLSWKSTFGGAAHTRMVSLIVSQGGILGQNL